MNPLIKLFTRVNAALVQATGGRLGGQLGPQSVLLLQTVGRKSGKTRVSPLSYYRDGDNYLVVASNWGTEHEPDWLLNLNQRPQAGIQVKNQTFAVTARRATAEEQPRLWELVTRRNPQFLDYQKSITRRIPVIILTPLQK